MPSYDLCPTVSIAEITRQIALAVQHVAGVTEGPLSLSEHSAGGHLVSRMLDRALIPTAVAERILHVVPISPLSDLRPLMNTSMNEDFKLDTEAAIAESPIFMTDRHALPVTVRVGGTERPDFLDHARWLSEAWGVGLVIAPELHHFDVIDDLLHRLWRGRAGRVRMSKTNGGFPSLGENMRRKSGTIRHRIAGTALALVLIPMLAGAEARACDWAEGAFWQRAEPARVAARDEWGGTPLRRAAGGTPETVAALLAAGADPKARDEDGRSPADLAEDNPAVRDHAIFWTLNQVRFD